ncbi:MAG: hypothetical protein WCG19_10510 [Chlorobiaceae bacterium]
MNLAPLSLFLIVISGICWTIVYLDSIRLGFKNSTYAMPFWALALNIAWEVQQAMLEYQDTGFVIQVGISAVWFLLDCVILYTYFRFGKKYFPANLQTKWFLPWSVLVLLTAFILEYVFLCEFGLYVGRQYAAFLQNLLMSVLFITMLVSRGNSEGQSLTIAVSKWLGTVTPTILFGIIGGKNMSGPSTLILVTGGFCSVFDLIYIAMLARTKALENREVQIDTLT